MTNEAYAQYLAEVTYPHGEYTTHGTVLVLREAFVKGFHAGANADSGEDAKGDPKHAAQGADPLKVAEDISKLLTNIGSAEKLEETLKALINGASKTGLNFKGPTFGQ